MQVSNLKFADTVETSLRSEMFAIFLTHPTENGGYYQMEFQNGATKIGVTEEVSKASMFRSEDTALDHIYSPTFSPMLELPYRIRIIPVTLVHKTMTDYYSYPDHLIEVNLNGEDNSLTT